MAALGSLTCDKGQAGEAMRYRLVAFVRVLRDNGFATEFAETQDALALLTDPIAKYSTRLCPAFRALFCGRRSDWEKFDEIFAAFWLSRGVKSALRASGSAGNHRAARGQSFAAGDPPANTGEPDRVARVLDESAVADGCGRREGASAAENFAKTDPYDRPRTAVVIVSDGYDTGEPALLGAEMRQLHRRCRRIVWLNPMLGWQDYSPEARG